MHMTLHTPLCSKHRSHWSWSKAAQVPPTPLCGCSLQYDEHVCDGVFDRRGTFSKGAEETFLSLEQLRSIQPDIDDDREVRPQHET